MDNYYSSDPFEDEFNETEYGQLDDVGYTPTDHIDELIDAGIAVRKMFKDGHLPANYYYTLCLHYGFGVEPMAVEDIAKLWTKKSGKPWDALMVERLIEDGIDHIERFNTSKKRAQRRLLEAIFCIPTSQAVE